MNSYKLDDTKMDRDFLDGKTVLCDAVVPESEYLADQMNQGERIVVLLSNGKKYMGQIVSFKSTLKNGFAGGKLEIIRQLPI